MKKIFALFFLFAAIAGGAEAFKLESQRELGKGEAKNQNIIVKCTTPDGKVSGQTCTLRRFQKCKGKSCGGWDDWKDLRNPGKSYREWRQGAETCCRAKGLR